MILRSFIFTVFVLSVNLLAETKKIAEPRITSIYPFTGQQGKTYSAVVRGVSLDSMQSLFFREPGIRGRVLSVEKESSGSGAASANPVNLLHVEIEIDAKVSPGIKKFGVITHVGTSNEITFRVTDQLVQIESSETQNIPGLPAVINGRISDSGEMDDYWIETSRGDVLTVEAFGNTALDPSITIYERSGSWFDADRLNRLAFNDELLNFPGMPKDAKLSHRFERAGKYCVRVQGMAGQGGPDSFYELRIVNGSKPSQPLRPLIKTDWEERELTRAMGDDWMMRVAARGAGTDPLPQLESYRAVLSGNPEIPVMKVPGIVEGNIQKTGEQHSIKINVERAQNLVIEVETPKATTPVFNPIVSLLEPGGTEIIGNVYTRLNNNNLEMMKSLKAKATFSLAAPGIYTLKIRELNTDHAGDDFQYRVLVRQQIPHVGKFIVQQERINLERGNTRPISVRIEREEGYTGTLAVQVENLPEGVSSLSGIENPDDRPPLPNAGKAERYQPKTQAASLVLAAASDAPVLNEPSTIRVTARPIRNGRLDDPIASTEVLLMVVNPQ